LNETIILVSLIVGFFAITIFALVALLAVRKREQNRQDSKGTDDAIARMDAALDSALVEMNKVGTLIKTEIDEKYQAMLFLYDLVDKKKAEIEKEISEIEIEAPEIDTTMLTQYLENHISELKLAQDLPDKSIKNTSYMDMKPERGSDLDDDVAKPKTRPHFTNPRHAQIWDMRYEDGDTVSEIARTLDMGKGEVQLILNLYSH